MMRWAKLELNSYVVAALGLIVSITFYFTKNLKYYLICILNDHVPSTTLSSNKRRCLANQPMTSVLSLKKNKRFWRHVGGDGSII